VDPLQEFALSLKAIERELERLANDAMQPLGVTAPQADAIFVIGQAQPLALKELGALLIAEAGHPSRLVDRLVEAGFVERQAAGDDRRRVELTLTPRGRRLEQRILAARERIREVGSELVGDRDLGPTLALFRHLLQFTALGEVIERRRDLAEREPRSAQAAADPNRSTPARRRRTARQAAR
jgi:DNA-binding MarR family transcriptional regulator